MKLVCMYDGYKKLPHIFSHIDVKLIPASPTEDFIFEEKFADYAFLVDIHSTPIFCEQMSCNAHKRGDGDCTYNEDSPSLFISHDTTFSQCEPACWLFGDDVVRTDMTKPDSLFVMWNGETCLFGNQAIFTYFTDPISRSKARWKAHVNTLPTGFDISLKNNKLYAKLNDEYCSEFNLYISDDGKKCEKSWWQSMMDYLPFGTTMASLIQSAIQNNWDLTPKEYDKDPDPSAVHPARLDRDAWLKRIDEKFKPVSPAVRLSDVGFTQDMLHQSTRKAFYYHNKEGRVLRVFNLYNAVSARDDRVEERESFFKLRESPQDVAMIPNRNISRAYLTRVKRIKLEWMKRNKTKNVRGSDLVWDLRKSLRDGLDGYQDEDDFVVAEAQDYVDQIKDICVHIFAEFPDILLKICSDWEGMAEMASQTAILYSLKAIKSVLLKLVEGTLAKCIEEIFMRISSRIFVHALGSLISVAVTRITSSIVGKLMILAAKLAIAMIDWIEWIQVIVMIIDIVYMLLDPFGMNNYMGQDDLDNTTDAFYEGLEEKGYANYGIDPLLYYNIIISQATEFGIKNYFTEESKKSDDAKQRRAKLRAASDNLIVYDEDENLFILSIAGAYYSTRTANSAGHPFNWELDVMDFSQTEVGTTIYQSLLSNADAVARFDNYNYMQVAVLISLVVVMLVVIVMSFTGLTILSVVAVLGVCTFTFLKFTVDPDAQMIAYQSSKQMMGASTDWHSV